MMNTIISPLTSIIEKKWSNLSNTSLQRLNRCQARCPCCRRVCDFDHIEDILIGESDNKHRCEMGHQLRGMGGVYYEMTGEASLLRCENLSDDDVVKIKDKRILWKQFKNENQTWLFPDPITSTNNISNQYFSTWKRIGEKLCDYYNSKERSKMKYVIENSPAPINHFIFVLDHSSSMNVIERDLRIFGSSLSINSVSSNSSNEHVERITPWKHLLRSIEVFIDIRRQLYSFNDQITTIIFGNKAKRIHTQESWKNLCLNDLDRPMGECGGGTNYEAAMNSVLEVLEKVNGEQQAKDKEKIGEIQQTIIFMSDGEPQVYGADTLRLLSTYKNGSVDAVNKKALIYRFWTMGLGSFNREILERINQTMGGNFKNIESAHQMEDAFAQIAEVCPVE